MLLKISLQSINVQTHLDMVVAFGEKGVGIFIPTWAKCFSMLSRLGLDYDCPSYVTTHTRMQCRADICEGASAELLTSSWLASTLLCALVGPQLLPCGANPLIPNPPHGKLQGLLRAWFNFRPTSRK